MSIDFFKQEPKPPFYYQFILHSLENEFELFDLLKNLFFLGISKLCNISIFNVHTLNDYHIEKVSEYFLSLGIKVYFKTFDYEGLHFLYEDLLNDLRNINDIEIITAMDHKTQFIQKVELECNITDFNKLKEYNKILDNHFILNYFEKWYTPVKLKQFYIPIEVISYQNNKKKSKCSLLYFDYYNNYSFLDYKNI